ncbi:MAG: ATP-binding domain-containing protein [Halobacteriota archaeon]
MEINANQPILNKHPSAKALISLLKENSDELALTEAIVYHNFPLYVDSDSSKKNPDVMIVSKNHGIIIFKCLDQSKRTLNPELIEEIIADFEQVYSLLFSKLIKSRLLRKSPISLIDSVRIKPALYIHEYNEQIKTEWDELAIVSESADLRNLIGDFKLDSPLRENVVKEILSIIEGSHAIIKAKKRSLVSGEDTKGRILEKIESEIATFDLEQKRAAIRIIDGPQRIRGLAGSGKTIVLAMKAARIHSEDSDARILYTYWTKQLHDYVKRLITRFYREFADIDPDWTKIDIMHAWGGKNLSGVYYNTCIDNEIPPITFGDVRQYYGGQAFNRVCEDLEKHNLKRSYDYSILDEGQDFPPYFYRLCRKITQNDRVIWGYDECQNILNMEIQDTIKTFGKKPSGEPYIDFSKPSTEEGQDMVLHKCYRNPRTILVAGMALGLGIYSDKIIQMPESKEHWEDLGFKILEGGYNTGDHMVISRPEENSPLIKDQLLDKDNSAIEWKVFDKLDEECQFIVDNIKKDLDEELLPQDIIVISLDDFEARNYFRIISKKLNDVGIKTFNLLDAPSNTTDFMVEDYITLTTVYRAKGNEAGSVYIVGVDKIFNNKHSIVARNKLFTAITRANAWATITGMGKGASEFEKEIKKVIDTDYQLVFEMPDLDDLKLFRRDLAQKQAQYNEMRRYIESKANELGMDKDVLLQELLEKKKA